MEKEENQTFGFELQVGEAGCRGREALGGGLRDGWILLHSWAEGPLACYRLMAFTTEKNSAWRW